MAILTDTFDSSMIAQPPAPPTSTLGGTFNDSMIAPVPTPPANPPTVAESSAPPQSSPTGGGQGPLTPPATSAVIGNIDPALGLPFLPPGGTATPPPVPTTPPSVPTGGSEGPFTPPAAPSSAGIAELFGGTATAPPVSTVGLAGLQSDVLPSWSPFDLSFLEWDYTTGTPKKPLDWLLF
jgi:hypothetical protein